MTPFYHTRGNRVRIRTVLCEFITIILLFAAALSPLGLFTDENGWGWYWPHVGGFYIDVLDESNERKK